MKENKYTISEAARLLSVENHVLRYWEEELELNIPRNELGHRYYREEEIQLLHCIKELKNKGFQLKAVKEVLPDLEQKKLKSGIRRSTKRSRAAKGFSNRTGNAAGKRETEWKRK